MKRKFEEKIEKDILLLVKKGEAKYEEINRHKKRLKKLEKEYQEITKQKISKENELLTLEITKQQITMQDVLKIIKNKDIISIYKEQEKTKEDIGESNVKK